MKKGGGGRGVRLPHFFTTPPLPACVVLISAPRTREWRRPLRIGRYLNGGEDKQCAQFASLVCPSKSARRQPLCHICVCMYRRLALPHTNTLAPRHQPSKATTGTPARGGRLLLINGRDLDRINRRRQQRGAGGGAGVAAAGGGGPAVGVGVRGRLRPPGRRGRVDQVPEGVCRGVAEAQAISSTATHASSILPPRAAALPGRRL